jgi:hypothetical protein
MLKRIIRSTLIAWGLLVIYYQVIPSSVERQVEKGLQIQYQQAKDIVDAFCKSSEYYLPNRYSISFGKLEAPVIGECSTSRFSWKIVIDQKFWARSDDLSHKTLLYHELSHCMFREEHSEDPKNYMYPNLPDDLDELTLNSQFLEIIKKHCKGE